jgi:transcriptional regulator with XRE-family HTH domain
VTARPNPALGITLRRLREERGLTLEDVAYQAGVTVGSLARIELVQSSPRWETVRSILPVLGVPLTRFAVALEAAELRQRQRGSV